MTVPVTVTTLLVFPFTDPTPTTTTAGNTPEQEAFATLEPAGVPTSTIITTTAAGFPPGDAPPEASSTTTAARAATVPSTTVGTAPRERAQGAAPALAPTEQENGGLGGLIWPVLFALGCGVLLGGPAVVKRLRRVRDGVD